MHDGSDSESFVSQAAKTLLHSIATAPGMGLGWHIDYAVDGEGHALIDVLQACQNLIDAKKVRRRDGDKWWVYSAD